MESEERYNTVEEIKCLKNDAPARFLAAPVAALLAHCREAVGGKTFQGWKGGDYEMDERTPLWVANPGESGSTAIVDVRQMLYVTIITEMKE